MTTTFTFIYAYRNRDHNRVRLSLQSLKNQNHKSFEVVFVDYGSTEDYAKAVKQVIEAFEFASYHYIAHSGLLWNKSKALNFGITKAKAEHIIIADVDVLFASNFIDVSEELAKSNQFSLFKIGYLAENVTSEIIENSDFTELKPKHYGDTFGIGLFPKTVLENIGGLDEFFHFYGSEDEDLNYRLIASGCQMNRCETYLLLHQWHERYPQKLKEGLTVNPRLTNIQRINQRHFLRHKETHKYALDDLENRRYFSKADYEILKKPSKVIEIDNVEANVIHLLNYELPLFGNDIVKLIFKESTYYNSSKYKIKTTLNKQTQPYLSMKQINDLMLQKIIFNYRDHNYGYTVSEDLKTIEFTIDLRN